MNTRVRALLTAATLSCVLLSSCGGGNSDEGGFVISLVESGEVILTDEHIEAYIWDGHRIILSPEGVARWELFVKFDDSHEPPIRQLGELTMKEFSLTIDGVEMYRGHCGSMASSALRSGVLLYDTLGAPQGEVWLSFTRLDGEPKDDPRARREIAGHLREQGKLKEKG